jgi:hypothetical protein
MGMFLFQIVRVGADSEYDFEMQFVEVPFAGAGAVRILQAIEGRLGQLACADE